MFVVAATNYAIVNSFQSTKEMKSDVLQAMDQCWKERKFGFIEATVVI